MERRLSFTNQDGIELLLVEKHLPTFKYLENPHMHDMTDLKITLGDHTDTEALVVWLSGSFADLEGKAQRVVDDYWLNFKEGRRSRRTRERGSLGLRVRSRMNGSFTVEWYETSYLGKTGRPIAVTHYRKGRNNGYPVRTLIAGQPVWMSEMITNTESALTDIRRRQALLVKIRQAVTTYANEVGGTTPPKIPMKGSKQGDSQQPVKD